MKIDFKAVDVPVKLEGTDATHDWVIHFKRREPGRSDVSFSVLSAGEVISTRKASMTEVENSVRVPFIARDGEALGLAVTNRTDTADLVITSHSVEELNSKYLVVVDDAPVFTDDDFDDDIPF